MDLYGLTGGIASGKTAAARLFAGHGLATIDADRVGHDVIAPGGAAAAAVVDAFGESVTTDGVIDREKLGARVFDDPAALQRLNALTHPVIFAEIGRRCQQLTEQGHACVLIDAALLAEGGQREPFLAGLIVVHCPAGERLRRMVEDRGMPRHDAERRLAAQSDPTRKEALADWVIDNSGTVADLEREVAAVAGEIKARYAAA